jgi:DNA invertase Pin-like site-specific DNA recombinase
MIHGYVRVSTEDQAREGRSSPEDQERYIRLAAQIRDINGPEPTLWRDLGVSGSVPVGSRPSGAAMLSALQHGDVVIAAKLDRLFRSAEDALTQSRAWREAGIDLVLVDMGTEPVTKSATGRLYFGMLAQFAEFERERIAERVRDGKAAKRARGGFVGGNAPIGHAVDGTGRAAMLVQDNREIEMVALARREADDLGRSPTRIARRLNGLGYRSRAGTPLTAAQIWRWLRLPSGLDEAVR